MSPVWLPLAFALTASLQEPVDPPEPDPLRTRDGKVVADVKTWRTVRRPEILELFQEHVYGRVPEGEVDVRFEAEPWNEDALEGRAARRQVTILLTRGEVRVPLHLLIYKPKREEPVPAFLALNFRGNHSIHADPAISLPTNWMPKDPACGVSDHRATEAGRGCRSRRWPVERIVERGYALATLYCGDADPDFHDGFENGVHALFPEASDRERASDAWGTIAAWAFSLSRALDYLEVDPTIDAGRVAVFGHSRLGKTALWAGAVDERFALTISNESGCGGAALSRRRQGETVERIQRVFPHWFCRNFRAYADREHELPVDQHLLIALTAPRPVYVASALEDAWADPEGEFLAARGAHPVHRLFGLEGLPATQWPEPNEPVHGTIGYHVRTGKHDVTNYDWERYLDFADRHLRSTK